MTNDESWEAMRPEGREAGRSGSREVEKLGGREANCWMLDAGYWMLGYWMIDTGGRLPVSG
jgi:hypothetical protein